MSSDAPNGVADPEHTNGAQPETTPSADVQESNAPVGSTEQEAEETAEPTASTDEPTEAQSTPKADGAASSKSAKRKSSAGVPEHKTKKLNKKKSTLTLNLDAKPGDYYWARVKGYAPWPAIICSQDMIPEELLKKPPVSAARTDGSYREDYAEGGKNAKDRTYPIMFCSTNEFQWMLNTQLTRLEAAECADYEEKKISKSLKDAYRIAGEQHGLEYYKNILHVHREEEKKFAEEQAELEIEEEKEKAEKAVKDKETPAKKKSRKSKGADVDTTTLDDEEDDAEAKPSKKRKKEQDSDGEAPKPKKTPKVKLTTQKTPKEPSAKKASKPKKSASKGEADDEEAPLTAEEKKERHDRLEKGILYLRHRLQKGFLSRETAPKPEEMAAMAEFFTQLEAYPDLDAQIIATTKIHKVLKGIVKLPTIPNDEEHDFKKRSQALLDSWNSQTAAAESAPASAIEPHTNGDSKETPVKSDDAPTKEAQADTTMSEADGKPENAEAAAAPAETEAADVTMADAKDDKIAPGSGDTAEKHLDGTEDEQALEANAGETVAE